MGERIGGAAPALAPVARLIRSSHERWDGDGYPDGLAGEEIPLGARVVFACDAFEAMTSERAWRPAIGDADALAELARNAARSSIPPSSPRSRRVAARTTRRRSPPDDGHR